MTYLFFHFKLKFIINKKKSLGNYLVAFYCYLAGIIEAALEFYIIILLQKIGEKAFILQSSYIFISLLRMRIDIHKRGHKKR